MEIIAFVYTYVYIDLLYNIQNFKSHKILGNYIRVIVIENYLEYKCDWYSLYDIKNNVIFLNYLFYIINVHVKYKTVTNTVFQNMWCYISNYLLFYL